MKSVSPVEQTQGNATRGDSSASVQVVGTYPSYFETSNSPVGQGTYFTNDDVLDARKVAVIGSTTAESLFGAADPVGERITVGGTLFRVVGVLQDQGSAGFQDQNAVVIAPLTTVQQSLTGYGSLSSILVQATSVDAVDAAEAEVTAILSRVFDIEDPAEADYQILNQAQLLDASSDTTRTFTVLLAAVAAISLLVGGIGITNIMLVTVTERTREIGIRKAVGARRGAILGQFLAEATILSAVGGALGVVAGVFGSRFTIAGVDPVIVPGLDRPGARGRGGDRVVLRQLSREPGGVAPPGRGTSVRIGKESRRWNRTRRRHPQRPHRPRAPATTWAPSWAGARGAVPRRSRWCSPPP